MDQMSSSGSGKREAATDVDDLVNMGYPIAEVKKALNVTQGDRTAALRILAKGGVQKEDTGWRKTTADDWVSGVSAGQPTNVVNRALQKSPVYIRVSSYVRKPYDVEYILKVTLKNGKQWEVARTYNQFSVFKSNLPLGTTMKFTNGFPIPNLFQYFFSEESAEFLQKRRDALSEWIREMTLNEECMTNEKVLNLLYAFIDYKQHHGDVKESVSSAAALNPASLAVNSPLLALDNEYEARKYAALQNIPIINETRFPLTVGELRGSIPFRVELKKLECGRQHIENASKLSSKVPSSASNEEGHANDGTGSGSASTTTVASPATVSSTAVEDKKIKIDMKQLHKDLSRDRIIIQGKKLSGYQTEVEEMVEISKQAMLQCILRSGHHLVQVRQMVAPPPPPPPGNYIGPPSSTAAGGGGASSAGVSSRHGSLSNVFAATPPPPPPPPTAGSISSPPTVADAAASSPLQLLDHAVKAAMQQISRTESAYLSHVSLHEMIDMNNVRDLPDFAPFLIVPESTLAQPLVLNFRVQEREHKQTAPAPAHALPVAAAVEEGVVRAVQPAGEEPQSGAIHVVALPHHPMVVSPVSPPPVVKEWCVVCEGEASTVYRLTDPETMKPIVQLRVTFVYTLFAIPVMDGNNSRVDRVIDFRLKEGKTYLVVAQDTTSTDRDW